MRACAAHCADDRLRPPLYRIPISARNHRPVRIIDADPEDDHIELELRSSRLGREQINFFGSAPQTNDFETAPMYVRRCPRISASSRTPPSESRTNFRFVARATDLANDVFPTPGGPVRLKRRDAIPSGFRLRVGLWRRSLWFFSTRLTLRFLGRLPRRFVTAWRSSEGVNGSSSRVSDGRCPP